MKNLVFDATKNLSDGSFDEDGGKGDKSQRGGGGDIVDKISYLQLIHNFPLC